MLLRRAVLVFALLMLVLVGCESSPGGAGTVPDELVEVTFVVPDAGEVQPAGVPFNPDGSGSIVTQVRFNMKRADGSGYVYFDETYTAMETGTHADTWVDVPAGKSVTVRVPPNWYDVMPEGRTSGGTMAASGFHTEEIAGPTSILLELESILLNVEFETDPVVDDVQPGDVIDVYVKPLAVDGVSPVPFEDFRSWYSIVNEDGVATGRFIDKSKLGARIEVAPDVAEVVLSVTLRGYHNYEDLNGNMGRYGNETYVFKLPVRVDAGITTDLDQPAGAITGHQAGTAVDGSVPVTFEGWVDGDATEIASITLYEGPKLVASTEAGAPTGITFPTSSSGTGEWYWVSDSISFADGGVYKVTMRVVDDATNEFVTEYALDLR